MQVFHFACMHVFPDGWCAPLASGYITHTHYDRDLIVQRYHIPSGDIRIIPHGLYDQYAHIRSAKGQGETGIKEDYVILFFGLLRRFKGVKFLIEGFEMLPGRLKEHSRLCIVGEAWEDQESVKKVQASPDKEKITMIDRYVSDEEVALYYSASPMSLPDPYTA